MYTIYIYSISWDIYIYMYNYIYIIYNCLNVYLEWLLNLFDISKKSQYCFNQQTLTDLIRWGSAHWALEGPGLLPRFFLHQPKKQPAVSSTRGGSSQRISRPEKGPKKMWSVAKKPLAPLGYVGVQVPQGPSSTTTQVAIKMKMNFINKNVKQMSRKKNKGPNHHLISRLKPTTGCSQMCPIPRITQSKQQLHSRYLATSVR